MKTTYEGIVKFSQQLSPDQFLRLTERFTEYTGTDREEACLTGNYGGFVIGNDLTTLRYNGTESATEVAEVLEAVLEEMRSEYSDFEMEGRLIAPADDIADRKEIFVSCGDAIVGPVQRYDCPHCGGGITLMGLPEPAQQ